MPQENHILDITAPIPTLNPTTLNPEKLWQTHSGTGPTGQYHAARKFRLSLEGSLGRLGLVGPGFRD